MSKGSNPDGHELPFLCVRAQQTPLLIRGAVHAWIHGVLDDLDGFADDLRAVTAADLNRVAAEVGVGCT